MYPESDGPWYTPAFTATCCLLVVCILSYLMLPAVIMWEARQRKQKYGHAMPLRAMEDAARSEATYAKITVKGAARHAERV